MLLVSVRIITAVTVVYTAIRDGHHTVTDTAIEVAVIYGHGCSHNRTVDAQSALAMALTVTFTVVMAIHMAMRRADKKNTYIPVHVYLK